MRTALAVAMIHALRHVAQVEDVSAPSGAVLSIGEIRHHVAQALEDDDAQLQALEQAAQRHVETYLGRAVLQRTRRAWYDGPFTGPVVLLPEPATSITSLTVYDEEDTPTTVAATVYQKDTVSRPARIVLRSGQSWPVDLREAHAIAIEYVDGWATGAAVPANIRQALLLLIAHLYEHPTAVVEGGLAELPLGVRALLTTHRLRTGAA
jgi:uncharacterized phiE125 gp8 family phage protein